MMLSAWMVAAVLDSSLPGAEKKGERCSDKLCWSHHSMDLSATWDLDRSAVYLALV